MDDGKFKKGHKHSPEVIKKIKEKRALQKSTPESRKKISESLKRVYEGNKELRKKISESSKLHWKQDSYREKQTGHH